MDIKFELVAKPNIEGFEKVYFIKFLSMCIRSKLGSPYHKIVAVTASTLFDDPTIDEKSVQKMT